MIHRVCIFLLMLTLSTPIFAQEKTKGQRTVPEIAKQTTKMERQGLNPQPEPPASQMNQAVSSSITGNIPQKTLMKIDRPVLRIQSFQNVQLSGDSYQWNASINNTCAETISNVLIVTSKKVNGTWLPAGADVTIPSITPNATRSLSGSWTGDNTTEIKFDLFAKPDPTKPYQLQHTKTEPIVANAETLAANLKISGITLTQRPDGELEWSTIILNDNNVAITKSLTLRMMYNINGQWKNIGESGVSSNTLTAHQSITVSTQTRRHPLATQFKTILRGSSANDIITESNVTTLPAETINLNITNLSASRQGTMVSWSASIANASSIAAAKIKVSTFHRAQGGSWITASNPQDLNQATAGATKQASGVFTAGESTQFKIVAEYQGGTFVGTPIYSQTFESETTF